MFLPLAIVPLAADFLTHNFTLRDENDTGQMDFRVTGSTDMRFQPNFTVHFPETLCWSGSSASGYNKQATIVTVLSVQYYHV